MPEGEKSFWDKCEIVQEIEKNGRGDIIRVEYTKKGDNEYVNIRVWYTDRKDGQLKPGREGICIAVDSVEEFIQAIKLAAEIGA